MEKEKIKQAKERYNEIEKIVNGDKAAEGLLRSLSLSALRYVDVSANMIAQIIASKDANSFRDETEFSKTLDFEKRYAHEALISNLNVLNRYLFNKYEGKVPQGGIYSLPPESIKNRHSVGDWAGYFVMGLKN
jgi:hypothetical protein